MMTTYRVWQEDDGDDSAMQRSAVGPETAAADQADYDYSERDGWDRSWPTTYIVEDIATGKRWKVSVGVDFDPSFHTGGAVEIKP